MFGFAGNYFFKQRDNKNSLHLSKSFDKKELHKRNLLERNKAQQKILEQQITLISAKLPASGISKNSEINGQPPLLLEQVKFLAVKLSLKIAEQRALNGLEVESVLQPIRANLIEKKAPFPIDIKWLEDEVFYISSLALDH